jgi:excisionase family DNA binding protein
MKPIQFADLSKLIGENIYSTDEAAQLLGVGVENIRKLIRTGKLKAGKVGRYQTLRAAELKKLVVEDVAA